MARPRFPETCGSPGRTDLRRGRRPGDKAARAGAVGCAAATLVPQELKIASPAIAECSEALPRNEANRRPNDVFPGDGPERNRNSIPFVRLNNLQGKSLPPISIRPRYGSDLQQQPARDKRAYIHMNTEWRAWFSYATVTMQDAAAGEFTSEFTNPHVDTSRNNKAPAKLASGERRKEAIRVRGGVVCNNSSLKSKRSNSF